jgi:uncharacterized tellurite resistance protein B-like protein
MYLNYLEENEKIAFLKLSHAVAHSDGDFCDNEKMVIGSYCNEMGIDDVAFNKDESIDNISNEFKSIQSQKIAILELMSIINANGEFKKEEKNIIDILVTKFNINEKYLEDVKNWTELMLSLIEQGNSLVQS